MLTTYDKSDRFRLTNTLLDILHRLYVIKLLSTVGTVVFSCVLFYGART